jgi:NADPH2 dehydrogenase
MPNLFSKITIRNHEIKNRVVMPPMVCFGMAAENGQVTDKNIEHYTARAQGGVGLIVVEATCVNKEGRLSPTQLGLWEDSQIDGFTRLAEACHRYGAKIMVQIHSAGLMTPNSVTQELVAPSAYSGKSRMGDNISARALTATEILKIQDQFAEASMRAQKAGLDGVELHGAHGYLISQFLSPVIYRRQDLYGGSAANRALFAVEIITKIRNVTSKDFIISCRIGCNEPELANGIENAKILQAAGLDLLHISTGAEAPMTGPGPIPVPSGFPFNWVVYGGTEIKKTINIPVIVVNGIRTPEQAGYLIENGLADFAALGKGLLVNPDWANEALQKVKVASCLDCKVCSYFRRDGAVCPGKAARAKAA